MTESRSHPPLSDPSSVTPQHCAVTPPDYTHKQTHSPTSEEQPFIALKLMKNHHLWLTMIDYNQIVNYIMITLLVDELY